MLKVLHITHDLNIGGLQKFILIICSELCKDIEFSILCLKDLGPLQKELAKYNIPVNIIKQTKNTDYISFFKVAEHIKKIKPDVIHTHNTNSLFDGFLGKVFSFHNCKFIHTDHGRKFPDRSRYMFLEWLFSHFIDKYISVSQQGYLDIKKFEKISDSKLIVIENGIKCVEINTDLKVLKQSLNLPLKVQTVIGVIARLEKVKGIEFLLQAFKRIIVKHHNIFLLIVGDGSERLNLEVLSEKLNISRNVMFLGYRDDVDQLLQLIDIYVLPSLSEGLPLGLLEAMSAGCAIIASNVGGVPSVIHTNKSGILVTPKNSCEIYHALETLIVNKNFRNLLSKEAVKHVNQNYCSSIMVSKYSLLYRS